MNEHDWIQELVALGARLRAEDGGCPWDRKQTHQTLKRYLIEETYELLDAIDEQDDRQLVDELGDVLLQIILHCQIASETARFDLQEVARRLGEKLRRRHPHVFGEASVNGADGVLEQWEEIKREEPAGQRRASALDGIPRQLPALSQAREMQRRASKLGFDWEHLEDVIAKLEEELAELKAALAAADSAKVENELGDLLFAVVNLSRFQHIDPEETLRAASRKFARRFRHVEQQVENSGKTFADFTLDQLDAFWNQAKNLEPE